MKKKVGIMTFHFAHNYGAVLQAYALMKYLSKKFDVEIVNYVPNYIYQGYSLNPFDGSTGVISFIYKILSGIRRYKQARKFVAFSKNCLNVGEKIVARNSLKYFTEKLDYLICGSDQVWNTDITGKTGEYFLDFVTNETKCLSYAASMGKDNNSEFFGNIVNATVQKYCAISVREKSCQDFLKRNFGIESEMVLDPVFLLDEKEWVENFRLEKKNEKKYILFYCLSKNIELLEIAKKTAKEKKLKLIKIHPMCAWINGMKNTVYNVGPKEFLDLIYNAEYVFTNSFHAMAFSVIFSKRMAVIPHKELGDRNRNLIELFTNHDGKEEVFFLEENDYDKNILEEYINRSKTFLDNALSKDEI